MILNKHRKAFGNDRRGNTLLRPGKIDKTIYFGELTTEEAKKLFKKYYPTGNENTFEEAINGKKFAISNLVAHFIDYKNSSEDATALIGNVEELV